MEARVARLESQAQRVDDRLVSIEKEVIRLEGSLRTDIAKLKGDLETRIEQTKNSVILWIVGTFLLGQFAPALKDWIAGMLR